MTVVIRVRVTKCRSRPSINGVVIDRNRRVGLRRIVGIIFRQRDEGVAAICQAPSRHGQAGGTHPGMIAGGISAAEIRLEWIGHPSAAIPVRGVALPADEEDDAVNGLVVIGNSVEAIACIRQGRSILRRGDGNRGSGRIDGKQNIVDAALRIGIEAVRVVRRSTERILTGAQSAAPRAGELPVVCPDIGRRVERGGELHLGVAPARPAPILTGAHMVERKVHAVARNAWAAVIGRGAGYRCEGLDEGVVRRRGYRHHRCGCRCRKRHGIRRDPVRDNDHIVGAIGQTGRQRELRGHGSYSGLYAGAAPIVGPGVVNVAPAGQAHDGVVGVHLRIIPIGGTLGDSIQASANQMVRAVRILGEVGNRGLFGCYRKTAGLINIEVCILVSVEDGAIGQIQHHAFISCDVVNRARRAVDRRKRIRDRIVLIKTGGRGVTRIRRRLPVVVAAWNCCSNS